MISITPLSGYKLSTSFNLAIAPSASDGFINWGDGSFTNATSGNHIYYNPGVYQVYAGTCAYTSAFFISVYTGDYYNDALDVSYSSLTAFEGIPNTFTINLSSVNPINTIGMYASGSNSIPFNYNRGFWSHLNPEWQFLDTSGNTISSIVLTGVPVISAGTILGYTASTQVQYIDDLPGHLKLFFTLLNDIPTNSRVYSGLTYTVSALPPTELILSMDGILPINGLQWADTDIPYVVSVANSSVGSNIIHSASGYLTNINFVQGCNGLPDSSYQAFLSSVNLFDSDGFPTGGYSINNLVVAASSIMPDTYHQDAIACGQNPLEIPSYRQRHNPRNIAISATGIFTVDGHVYTLTGTSNPFDVYKLENFHQIRIQNDDKTVYDLIKQYGHFDLDQLPMMNAYLSAIGGYEGMGKAYGKIQNLPRLNTDIDTCRIDAIFDIAEKLDNPIDSFGISFPIELNDAMDLFSIPLQRLIGGRDANNMRFAEGKNIGDQLFLNSTVHAGDTILIKENGASKFDVLYISNTGTIQNQNLYPLNIKGVDNFCYYKWDQSSTQLPFGGIVDYNNPNTLLDPDLVSSSDFYGENGVLEETLNYILTKNLLGTNG
jgi:hypothetical protein